MATDIYRHIEAFLTEHTEPQTCFDVLDAPEIKAIAHTAARASDYLGHMYRRGLLDRWRSGEVGARVRYAYTLKAPETTRARIAAPTRPEAPSTVSISGGSFSHTLTLKRDEHALVVELDDFTITIARKG